MEVGVLLPLAPEEMLFAKVEEALDLLSRYDPQPLARLRAGAAILVFGNEGPRSEGPIGEWFRRAQLIRLAEWKVAQENTQPAHVAATIVHEISHAWLEARGVAYTPERRRRIEAICYRAEARFASRIPGGDELAEYYRTRAERILAESDAEWSDAAFRERDRRRIAAMGVPGKIVTALGRIFPRRTTSAQ